MLTISDLPALNATLNGIAAILLVTGYLFIKRGRQRQHQQYKGNDPRQV